MYKKRSIRVMADRALLRYREHMDYTEIQSFCGYDMQLAHEAALKYRAEIEEEMQRVGLETIQSKSLPQERRGLCGKGDFRSSGPDVVRSL